jgi:hypothetical protein
VSKKKYNTAVANGRRSLDSLNRVFNKTVEGFNQATNSLKTNNSSKDITLDSLIRDAQQKAKDTKKLIEGLRHKYQSGNALVLWNDTLEHDTDPVTDVVIRLHQGQPVTADDLLCNDNILLIFSLLKQQFLAGQNTEFNAISVYTLCKRAREYGFFSSDFPDFPNGKAELEQLKRDIAQMKANAATDTIRNYLQMAIAELDKIK